MADLSGWIQAGVAGIVAATGTVFWAGDTNNRVHSTEARVEAVALQRQADHDDQTRLDSKVDDLRADVSEIKADLKKLLANDKKQH